MDPLLGSRSDPLAYAWSQTNGLLVTLMGSDTAYASVTAPTVSSLAQAMLRFEVQVEDGQGGQATDAVSVRLYMVGDADHDDEVTVLDQTAVVTRFGLTPTDPGWDPNCDFDGDSEISVLDIVACVTNFGRMLE